MADAHDSAYKQFFSHALMVQELLEGFVGEDWVKQLDFATLEKINGHYVSEQLRQRSDDVVWKVRMRNGSDLYLYLLLEFQSSSDPWMAVRLLTYVGLLYQDLIKSQNLKPADRLPPVFPIVIYNGEAPWSAARHLRQLIAAPPGAQLGAYQPRFRYYLFDEGRIDSETLKRIDNTVASLVRLEGSPSPQAIREQIARLAKRLRHPDHASLRRAFTVWIIRFVMARMMPGETFPQLDDLQEIDTMLAQRVETWIEQWKREGLEQGEAKGRAEGEATGLERGERKGAHQGRIAQLRRQLTRRFGPLPADAEARLQAASIEQLDAWADAIFDAPTLEALLQSA